ncbi:MAG: hypothetical protein KatS3mg105_2687 [Gemmatales bacterium]|nr:MAG: hypothetical protein KatS3mg105_2687 [Gemmatales bacterium]
MYSVVMMMALTTGAENPAFFFKRCHGCTSRCHGCASACHGCYSSCHGRRRLFGWRRCHGCHGCHGCYSSCHGCYTSCHGSVSCHGTKAAAPEKLKMPEGKKEKIKKPPEEKSALPAPATIIVSLPADAQLTIDDFVTKSTSNLRSFVSPTLEPNRDFYYTLTAKVTRDGKPVSVSKQVKVRAGEQVRVDLEIPTSVASR